MGATQEYVADRVAAVTADKRIEDESFLSVARLIVDGVLTRYGIELSEDEHTAAKESTQKRCDPPVERHPVRISHSDAA